MQDLDENLDDDTEESANVMGSGKCLFWNSECPLVFPTLQVAMRQSSLFKFMIRLLKQNGAFQFNGAIKLTHVHRAGGVNFGSETETFNLEVTLRKEPARHMLSKMVLEFAWLLWSLARRYHYYKPTEVRHDAVRTVLMHVLQAQSIPIRYPLRTHLRSALDEMNGIIDTRGLGEGRHHKCSSSDCSKARMETLVKKGTISADDVPRILAEQDGVITIDECGKTANKVPVHIPVLVPVPVFVPMPMLVPMPVPMPVLDALLHCAHRCVLKAQS